MKKFLAVLLVVLSGAVALFADDVADVKAVIVKDLELVAKGDFAGSFALYAPDYRETGSDGNNITYEHCKVIMLAVDGKHPEEFLLMAAIAENNGAMPSAEAVEQLRAAARAPEIVKKYEELLPQVIAQAKSLAEQHLKTLEFVSVEVDGDKAVAVIEYDSKDEETGKVRREIETISLRKTDGAWLKYRSVSKYK